MPICAPPAFQNGASDVLTKRVERDLAWHVTSAILACSHYLWLTAGGPVRPCSPFQVWIRSEFLPEFRLKKESQRRTGPFCCGRPQRYVNRLHWKPNTLSCHANWMRGNPHSIHISVNPALDIYHWSKLLHWKIPLYACSNDNSKFVIFPHF